MKIYLAELSHINKYRSPNVVPLAAGFLAAYVKKYYPDSLIRIFRDPSKLLESVKSENPDLVGFSVYLWSEKLSGYCAEKIKSLNKNIVTVAGGASIDDIDQEIGSYLNDHKYYDVCVSNEGEIPLKNLVGHLQKFGRLDREKVIEGCATLTANGSLNRVITRDLVPDLSDIPSPYLGGFLDSFLEDGYIPILQSMRGCPYSCAFCVSGSPFWKKIRAFDLGLVQSEFDHIKSKSKSNFLILTDENFGILKERDVKIAEYIFNSYQSGAFPARLYFYPAKKISKHVLKIMETLTALGEFSISFQSLDDSVKKKIKRININYDEFISHVSWAKARNIVTSTEMIFGLPGETVEGYLVSLEKLLKSGVERIYSYNLRLLDGTDLATPESIRENEYKLMYRLPERTYGQYDGNFVSEAENVVVSSKSFSFDDYLKVRKYGLFLELISGRGYFSKLIEAMRRFGLPGEKLLEYLSRNEHVNYPVLSEIIGQYMQASRDELFDNPEDCIEFVKKCFYEKNQVPEVKLNYIFGGRIIFDQRAKDEILRLVKEFIESITDRREIIRFFADYLDNILSKQIVHFEKNEADSVASETNISLERFLTGRYSSLEEASNEKKQKIELLLHPDAKYFVNNPNFFEAEEDTRYQEIFINISRFGLLRQIKSIG